MDINKIKELRAIVPIPIGEAKELLLNNAEDVEQCVYLYKDKVLKQIVAETGCNRQMASNVYEEEKLDINRTISVIKEKLFDKHYKPIKGVNVENMLYVRDWMYIVKDKDLGISLAYKHLPKVIELFKKIPKLNTIATTLEDALVVYKNIFDGYNDDMPMNEFIRRNCLMDGSPAFQKAFSSIPLQMETIKDEIRRHWRNVEPKTKK